MHRLTATDTPMVRYTRTIFPSYANQDLKDKNDNVQSECDMHAFVRGKDYYGGKNNG